MQKSRRKDGFDDDLRLYHNKTEAYNAETWTFVEVVVRICQSIAEKGKSMSDLSLNKWLYFVLNLSPYLNRLKSSYEAILDKGLAPTVIQRLKGQLAGDIGKIVNAINKVPIMYNKPEEDLAELHFNGAFGRGLPDPHSYNVECSLEVANFDIEAYKQIRSAFTVEDLEQIESRDGKFSVLYILTGYYLNAYYNVVAQALQRAGLGFILPPADAFIELKLDVLLKRLTGDNYNMFVDAEESNPPSKQERMSLLTPKFCDRKIKNDMGKFLDEMRKDFKIGTKACSKRDFANIVFVFTQYMDCWNESHFATNRKRLSEYYGIKETTYKISECRKFENTEDGKNLIRKIQDFCSKH